MHALLVYAWVFSGWSSFLLQSEIMHVRLNEESKLPVWVSVSGYWSLFFDVTYMQQNFCWVCNSTEASYKLLSVSYVKVGYFNHVVLIYSASIHYEMQALVSDWLPLLPLKKMYFTRTQTVLYDSCTDSALYARVRIGRGHWIGGTTSSPAKAVFKSF